MLRSQWRNVTQYATINYTNDTLKPEVKIKLWSSEEGATRCVKEAALLDPTTGVSFLLPTAPCVISCMLPFPWNKQSLIVLLALTLPWTQKPSLFCFFLNLKLFNTFQFNILLLTITWREIHTVWKQVFGTTKPKSILFHTCSIDTLVWQQHHIDQISCDSPEKGIQWTTAILFKLYKNKYSITQQKAGKLMIWFCCNLPHLFCIQLLIMFFST